MRSVDKFFPWVHKIFIVTDNQIPKWLKKHPKVQIIDHKEIFPKDSKLPSFNSMAIELCLPNIKKLGKHFIYLNDDIFFGRQVYFSSFFDNNSLPISYSKRKWMWQFKLLKKITPLYNTRKVFFEKFNKIAQFSPEHVARPYRKSWLKEAYSVFSTEIKTVLQHQFRNYNDVNFYLYDIYQIIQKKSPVYMLGKKRALFERFINDWKIGVVSIGEEYQNTKLNMIKKHSPLMFCLNDNEHARNESRNEMKVFLNDYFPKKSQFEK